MSPLLPGVVYSLLPNQCLNCSLLLEETFVSTPQSQYLVIAGGVFRFEVKVCALGGYVVSSERGSTSACSFVSWQRSVFRAKFQERISGHIVIKPAKV